MKLRQQKREEGSPLAPGCEEHVETLEGLNKSFAGSTALDMSAVSGVKSLPVDTKTVCTQFPGSALRLYLRQVIAPSCPSALRRYKPGERIPIQTILYLQNPL